MKTLSIINLHKAEIKKNQLARIKGGIEIRCFCSQAHPHVSTRESGGTMKVCLCTDGPAEAGVSNRPD